MKGIQLLLNVKSLFVFNFVQQYIKNKILATFIQNFNYFT